MIFRQVELSSSNLLGTHCSQQHILRHRKPSHKTNHHPQAWPAMRTFFGRWESFPTHWTTAPWFRIHGDKFKFYLLSRWFSTKFLSTLVLVDRRNTCLVKICGMIWWRWNHQICWWRSTNFRKVNQYFKRMMDRTVSFKQWTYRSSFVDVCGRSQPNRN